MTGVAQLLATAAEIVPALAGTVLAGTGGPPWHAPGRGDLAALQRHWTASHPEAGPHYAALRGWGLLIWQPAYLSVIAVHRCGACPRLAAMSQSPRAGQIEGYTMAEHAMVEGDEASCLHLAAAQLANGCDELLAAWRELAPLHPKAARRTLADCLLAALLAVRRHEGAAMAAAATQARSAQWLSALGLQGESGYFRYRTAGGDESLALDRKLCCLHFRRRDGERCSTCPGRSLRERIACLNLE
jgi:siderophore ferric iron reductase